MAQQQAQYSHVPRSPFALNMNCWFHEQQATNNTHIDLHIKTTISIKITLYLMCLAELQSAKHNQGVRIYNLCLRMYCSYL